MTTKLRARVRKAQNKTFWVIDFNGVPGIRLLPQFAMSQPEAIQIAYKHLADLDAALMDEVHESRAARRIPAPIPATDHLALTEATA